MEDLGSIGDSSHVNVCLVATPAMISWLAYREYHTYDCNSSNSSDGGGGCSEPINCSTTRPGCDERRTPDSTTTTTTKGLYDTTTAGNEVTTRRYYRTSSALNGGCGGDRLTNSQGRRGLPGDVLISICSYLHPRDVTSFASVNRSSLDVLDGRYFITDDDDVHDEDDETNTVTVYAGGLNWKCKREGRVELKLKHTRIRRTSNNLWKSLWYRDYGRVLLGWHIGREALRRSLQPNTTVQGTCRAAVEVPSKKDTKTDSIPSSSNNNSNKNDDDRMELSTLLAQKLDTLSDMKYFYFSFLETYMDYVLAGQNTPDCCLLGMHGHIFDFTDFAEYHPGLAEPIRLECGKDATQYFEDLPHSSVARKIARKLCVLVDRACLLNHHHSSSSSSSSPNNHKNNNGCTNGGGNNTSNGSCGLYLPPTQQWSALNSNSRPPPRGDVASDALFGLDRVIPITSFTEKKRANSLRCMRGLFDREQQEKRVTAATTTMTTMAKGTLNEYLYTALFSPRRGGDDSGGSSSGSSSGSSKDQSYSDMHVHGRIHVYYDPFDQRWKSWYTRLNLQPAYCELD